MTPGVGVAGALAGGVLLLLSPCAALLLPSFFAYAFGGAGRLAARTGVFYLGLATVMVPLGAGVGAFSALVTRYRSTAAMVGGIALVVFGVVIILGKGFTFGAAQRASASIKISGSLSVYLLGTVYALAGFCAGPLVGAVLSLALVGGNPAYGALIGAVFALGMAVPLFLLALLWDRFRLGEKQFLRGRGIRIGPLHTHTTSLISGLLFIVIGALFLLTDGTANIGGILGVDTDADIQETVGTVAGKISDTAVLFTVAAVAALLLGLRLLLRRRRDDETSGDGEDSSDGEDSRNGEASRDDEVSSGRGTAGEGKASGDGATSRDRGAGDAEPLGGRAIVEKAGARPAGGDGSDTNAEQSRGAGTPSRAHRS